MFATAIGYRNAGTAEFLVDGDDIYFLELNGRIQVEHPVTEEMFGTDLVALQLRRRRGRVARHATCPSRGGHAIEARLYAEDPRTFLPQAGRIDRLRLPSGVRVDAGVEEGDTIGTSYDPMIAKLIAHAQTREEALDLLARGARRDRGRRRDHEPAVPALARRASGVSRGPDSRPRSSSIIPRSRRYPRRLPARSMAGRLAAQPPGARARAAAGRRRSRRTHRRRAR